MRRLTALLKQSDEQIEARVQGLNDLVRFLTATVEMPPIKILGAVLIAPDAPAAGDQTQTVTTRVWWDRSRKRSLTGGRK
jgi:hypothetical protein